MERSFVFLQYFLMILLAKYATSSNCTCKLPEDFCKPNITAVQGKVLGSQLANETGDMVSDISMAHKTRYRVNVTQFLINGTHQLHVVNNTFKIPVRVDDPCHFNFTVGSNHIFVGHVNGNGKWSKLKCNLEIKSSGKGNKTGGGFALGDGDNFSFSQLCSTS